MIEKIGRFKFVQNIIKKTSDEKFMEKIDRTLPLWESTLATGWYCVASESDKKIPRERKPALLWQNIIGGVMGITLARGIDSFAVKHKNLVCTELEKLNIPSPKNIIKGTRVMIPLVITAFCTRYLMSVLSVRLSSIVASKIKDTKKNQGEHLDIHC